MPQGVVQQPMPPMPPLPMSRRARWGQRMTSGAAMITNSLPDWFATYAFATYLVALVGVNLMYSTYATEWYFWLFGIAWVAGFFYLSVKYSREWSILRVHKTKIFEKKLFQTGFLIRMLYVVFIYFFYLGMTGKPYEFQWADSWSYVEETAYDWSLYTERGVFWDHYLKYIQTHLSDSGYPLSIVLIVYWFGLEVSPFIIRILQALIGAYTAVIIYRITSRSMGETTARLSAIFCMLHPVLICYCGITLKEVLMTFLLVLFIDMGDRMLRGRVYTLSTIGPSIIVGMSLFMFRTVLGMIAFMALFFALIMMSHRIVSFWKKISLGVIISGILLMSMSDNIIREVQQIRDTDVSGRQRASLEYRYGEGKEKGYRRMQGNAFAKYAGATVFAPLMFTIPFPTMAQLEEQEDMRLIHGGNWMRNIMSGFVIFAMFLLLLTGDWRKYTLPLAMLLGYLMMLTFTEFAHSLRFHIPVMPFEMMFAAYAIANMRKKHRVWYLAWCIFTIATCFAWNWFKLAGRGLA